MKKPELKAEKETIENSSISMDDLTQEETFPAPDEEAIASILENKNQPINVEIQDIKTDEKFNPEIHRVDDAGNPVLTKTGKYRRKTGWKFIRPEEKPENLTKEKIPTITSRGAARIASGTIERLSMVLISDEFRLTPDEKEENVTAWENCIEFYGGCKLSPPWELMANQVGIILTRMDKPKTQNKLALVWLKIKGIFVRGKKHGALSDSRNDGFRENDLGKEKSSLATESAEKLHHP